MRVILGKDNVERLPLPVGTSDLATFSRDSYCVDKTLMIKDLIDSKTRVALFTRPRRFGKTTAMRMIREFYDGDASLFHDKQIWAAGEKYRAEQGAHPVVFLTFKDVKQLTVEEAFEKLSGEIIAEVCRFPAFIIEVKKADAATDDLKALAREAREQIDGKQYDTAFRAEGIADIEKIGLAYFKNAVEISR